MTRLDKILGSGCMLLGAGLAISMISGDPAIPSAAGPRPNSEASSVPPPLPKFDLGPIDAFSEIVDRPLFVATRRPPSPLSEPTPDVVKENENPAPLPPEVTLKGVVYAPDRKSVLVRWEGSEETKHLTEGQTIGTWRVERILEGHLILRSGERSMEVLLVKPNPEATILISEPMVRDGVPAALPLRRIDATKLGSQPASEPAATIAVGKPKGSP